MRAWNAPAGSSLVSDFRDLRVACAAVRPQGSVVVLQRAAPAVRLIRRRAVTEFAVKEQRVTRAQWYGQDRRRAILGRRGQAIEITLASVRQDARTVTAGHNVHTPVVDVGVVAGNPEADHIVGYEPKIGVVLVPDLLAADDRRLHQEHALHEHDGTAKHPTSPAGHCVMPGKLAEKGIVHGHPEQLAHAKRARRDGRGAVEHGRLHLDHCFAGFRAGIDDASNGGADRFDFFSVEQTADHGKAVFGVVIERVGGEVRHGMYYPRSDFGKQRGVSMAGPLAGIRVIEFSQVIAAPFAGQFLAELGADVLKIEPPGGDSWRLQQSFAPGESRSFQTLNRGKRDMILSLDKPEARAIAQRLVEDADVVIINYRPDVPVKMGIDYETLSAINPNLVYADLTAFGRKGPWAMRPGYDGVVQAVTGLMAGEAKLREDGAPGTIASTAIADFGSGMIVADAIIAGLVHRERTGEGQLIECSLFATALNLQGEVVMEHASADARRNEGREVRRAGQSRGDSFERLTGARRRAMPHLGAPESRCWLTADGAVAISAERPDQIARLREMVIEAWGKDGQIETEKMRRLMETRTTAEWLALCADADVPAARVNFPVELMDEAQVTDNELMVELEHETTGAQTVARPPLDFSATPLDGLRASPPLGRDTDAVLAELGYSAEKIAALREEGGVIS